MEWNPHAPDVLGPEFQPKSGSVLPAYVVNAARKAAAVKIRSTATEAVEHLGVFLAFPKAKQQALIEILDAENPAPPVVTTSLRATSGTTIPDSHAATPSGELYTYLTVSGETFDPDRYIASQGLDDPPPGGCGSTNVVSGVGAEPTYAGQDFFRGVPTSATYSDVTVSAHLAFPTVDAEGGGLFAGRRILDIRVHVVAAYNYFQQTAPASGGGFENIGVPSQPQPLIVESRGFDVIYPYGSEDGHTNYQMKRGPFDGAFPIAQAQWGHYLVSSAEPQEYVFSCGEMNPHPRRDGQGDPYRPRYHPWSEFEMTLFSRSMEAEGDCPHDLWPINVYGASAKIFQVWMEVDHCPENRVAVAFPRLTHLPSSNRIYGAGVPGGSADIGGLRDTQPPGWTMNRPYIPNPITGVTPSPGGPPLANGGIPVPSVQPRAFTKDEDRDYLVLVRQPRFGTTSLRMQSDGPSQTTVGGFISTGVIPGTTGAEFHVPYLEGFTATPDIGAVDEYPHVSLNSWGLPEVLGEPSGNRVLGVYLGKNIRNVDGSDQPLIYGTGQGVVSDECADSQPYIDVPAVEVTGSVRQGITGASAQPYDGVLIVGRYTPGPLGTVTHLIARLRRADDDVVLATATVTQEVADLWPADVQAGWRRIQVAFDSPPTLTPGFYYYVDFIRPPGPGTWEIASLNSKVEGEVDLGMFQSGLTIRYYHLHTYSWEYDNQPYGGSPPPASSQPYPARPPLPAYPGPDMYRTWPGTATYGGEVQKATVNGFPEPAADLAVLVYAKPDPPTSVVASPQLLIMGETGPCGASIDCGLQGVPYVSIQWVPPANRSNFAYYEIQRSDPYEDWATIAAITNDEGVRRFDIEARFNVESFYRIRTVNVVGIVSDWLEATPGVYLPSAGCGYSFSSNAYVEASVGYPDVYDSEPTREFEFPESDELVLRTILGRDDFVAFRPAEQRGDRFTRTLMVNGTDEAARPGPRTFDPLRSLVRAPLLPYVCVRDEDGNRWFAAVNVPAGRYRKPTNMHWVDVTIDVVTQVPAVVSEVS